MILKKWEDLPIEMQTDEVRKYYDILQKKKGSLIFKRCCDIFLSSVMLVGLFPVFILLGLAIKLESRGPIFYRQERVTRWNRRFRIFKFRSMVQDADKTSLITVKDDSRITRVGRFMRRFRIDELSQLIDVLRGTMTFVGTRPEVPKYTAEYTPEMMATLLLPAGVTSLACVYYKDEADMLSEVDEADRDRIYVEKFLPAKMYYNLKAIEEYSIFTDIKIMLMTVLAVLGVNYKDKNAPHIKDKEQDGE